MEIEEKTKGRHVCLGGGGGRIYSIPGRASCFALVDLEERLNSSYTFKLIVAKQLRGPPTDATTFAFAYVSILLLYFYP